MPVLSASRRVPGTLAWFGTAPAAPLLAAERALAADLLARLPNRSWLWLAPDAAAAGAVPVAARGVRLHRHDAGLSGALRCGLPLPLASESLGGVVVQHALDDGGLDGLLEEAARILEPGGKLWLFALNPWSPYRLRWRRAGLAPRQATEWSGLLRQAGLQDGGEGTMRVGPAWRVGETAARRMPGSLRAVNLLCAEKRSGAAIPPAKAEYRWRAGAATA